LFKISDTHYAATWLLHQDSPQVEPPEAVKKRMKKLSSNYTKPELYKEGK
jgi:oligopeptide transport system ATP-binding protein